MLVSTIICAFLPLALSASLLSSQFLLPLLGSTWLAFQALNYKLAKVLRHRLDLLLESCMLEVNRLLVKHNLLLGVLNYGGLFEEAKLSIPLLYFDTSACEQKIESIVRSDLRMLQDKHRLTTDEQNRPDKTANGNSQTVLNYSLLELELVDAKKHATRDTTKATIKSTSSNIRAEEQLKQHFVGTGNFRDDKTQISNEQRIATKIILKISQRWISFFDQQKLAFSDNTSPRHLSTGKCLCQFVEEHFGSATNCNKADKSTNSNED